MGAGVPGRGGRLDWEEISEMKIAVMGVDPGVNGGLAVLSPPGHPVWIRPFRPEMTREQVRDIVRTASDILLAYESRICFFEKVHHMTGDGGKGSHTFGYIKGLLQGLLLANGMTLHDVPPMMWQAKMECLSGGNKNVTKNKAKETFPDFIKKITHNTADAMLIAKYGWLMS